jgi:two-component system nitrogen regulation response regulator GlnG
MAKDITSILIVDDEADMCRIMSNIFEREGINVLVANDGNTALQIVHSELPDILLVDVRMPGMDGMEVLRESKKIRHDLPVIMITAHADTYGAVKALREGALDYIAKPFNNRELVKIVRKALTKAKGAWPGRERSVRPRSAVFLHEMMGSSDSVGRIVSQVECVAESDFAVVIVGESGTGKELVSRAIHEASSRSKAPFVPVDCGAIPETLLESELFGYEKGAFTGANLRKHGKIESVQGGTLFLDEISNMPLGSQAKLLRVLQEKKIYRVGGVRPVDVDLRLIVATNRDLQDLAASGSFRDDLFFRLNEFSIRIPPLRERKEDIPYLAKRFLDITNMELNKKVKGFSESALEGLFACNWPGNVRQLRSTIRRAVLLADEIIDERHLDLKRVPVPGLAFTPKFPGMPWKGLSLREIVRNSTFAVEREVLMEALKLTGGNKAKAARMLRIDYKTIHTKLKQLGISKDGGE